MRYKIMMKMDVITSTHFLAKIANSKGEEHFALYGKSSFWSGDTYEISGSPFVTSYKKGAKFKVLALLLDSATPS
jgi:hypothetical protein